MKVSNLVPTCSSDSWEMWFTAAYDSILGLKWLMMALKYKRSIFHIKTSMEDINLSSS